MNDEKLVKNLSKLFTNKKFLQSIEKSKQNYGIKYSYGEVLEYYICTRDENFDQSYDEIKEKLYKIKSGNFEELGLTQEQVLLNSRENGFMTSAQNGNKAYRIKKYGLDYFDKLNEKEGNELTEAREALNKLENFLGKSTWVENDEKEGNPQAARQYFFSTPGPKTIHYALSASPERLYRGPLEGIDRFPRIYGEPKKEYYFRFVKDKIAKLGLEDSREEIMNCMDKVFEIYCKNPPIIVMLSNKQAFNVRFCNGMLKGDISKESTLEERFKEQTFGYDNVETYFSQNDYDGSERNNAGDLVTVVDQIPKEGVKGYITMLDDYEISQIMARECGAKIGDIISGNGAEKNNLFTLTTALKYASSNEEFEYLTQKCNSILQADLPAFKEKYGELSKEELENRINELKAKKEEIFDRDFAQKEGIESTYTLRQTVYDLEQQQMYDKLLDDDENIKNDEFQYESQLHGANHTRRVNFFANVMIMRNKDKLKNYKDEILAAVKNHDIGRIHDGEDKEHGADSAQTLKENPERLEDFSDEEKEVILFAVREHSLSQKENETDLDKLLRQKLRQKNGESYSPEKEYDQNNAIYGMDCEFAQFYQRLATRHLNTEKQVMCVLKNSDKLDRVRLDPHGRNPREGLDVERFAGDDWLVKSAKEMEYLAYESLEKLPELLDTDRELRDLEKYLYLEKGAQALEENIPLAKQNIQNSSNNKKALVSGIAVGGLSQINEVVRKMKSKIIDLFQERDGFEKG